MTERQTSRRRFLTTTGALAVTGVLAGCSGGGGGGGSGGGGGGDYSSAEQRVVDYLQAKPTADNFGGSFADETGMDTVSVKVGAEGNGGHFAFAPPALKISTGTTISWKWTGEGGSHNVVSTKKDTYEGSFSSDFDFKSGDPKATGDPFTQSFDSTGVGLYYCNPHKSLGMKGGFVVVE